tara:strand:- start:876 stop:1808 length:933 start_codon:yes stop_codon:yes gene_type:complete
VINRPLVSIIMNCYNGEKFLKEAIDSVMSQSYTRWEIIFWDNASSDNSAEIAETYGAKIKLFKSEETTSLGEARSRAIKKAKGDWLAFLDVDDVWLPQKLEHQLAGLINSNHILSYCGITEVDQNLNVIRKLHPRWVTGDQLSSQLRYFEINLVTSVINRQKLLELGIDFDERMEASEEYNLFIRLLPHGTVFVCNEILALYRVYEESLTFQKMDRWSVERRITLEELAVDIPNITATDSYKVALRQADYYEACSLMSKGSLVNARYLLGKYKSQNMFKILFYVSYIPPLWKALHNPIIKKRLTSFLRIH